MIQFSIGPVGDPLMRCVPLIGCLLSCISNVAGQQASPTPHWPTERVELRTGQIYEGYVESEDAVWVHMTQIMRPAGRPTYLVIRPIERKAITTITRLDPRERATLRRRIDQLIRSASIERARMEAIELDRVDRDGISYHRYRGKWFTLDCNAEEAVTRRMAVRIEQVFTAYRQILLPGHEARQPLRLVVLDSMHAYRETLARFQVRINNPACYILDDNLVVVGSELARFAEELIKIKALHARIEIELKELEQRLPARLKEMAEKLRKDGVSNIREILRAERRTFQEQIDAKRLELKRTNRRNARAFDDCTAATFAHLYHEAFHAYLENYVFPRRDYDVPPWLNEGLAVMFERGVLESETYRVDAPHREALKFLKTDLNGSQPLSLKQVLEASREAFLTSDAAQRNYAYSWGLAYYLTFERNLLKSPAMARYLRPAAEGTSPVERFEELVEMPLAEFEKHWRRFIKELR